MRLRLETVADAFASGVAERPSHTSSRNDKFRALIQQRESEVDVIQEHVRRGKETMVSNVVPNGEGIRADFCFVAPR